MLVGIAIDLSIVADHGLIDDFATYLQDTSLPAAVRLVVLTTSLEAISNGHFNPVVDLSFGIRYASVGSSNTNKAISMAVAS